MYIQEEDQKEEMDQPQDQVREEPLFLFNLNYKFILGVQLIVPLISAFEEQGYNVCFSPYHRHLDYVMETANEICEQKQEYLETLDYLKKRGSRTGRTKERS